MELTGNTILITGGASGIGLSLAERFINLNNRVIVCDVGKISLATVKAKLKNIRVELCDVTDDFAVKTLAEKLEKEEGGINILINNAGIGKYHNFLDDNFLVEDTLDELQVNLIGPIRMTKHFLSQLRSKKNPAIINISAGLAYIPYYKAPIYSASKAALHSYTKSLRYQCRDTNIKVIEIFPPPTATRLSNEHPSTMSLQQFVNIVIKKLKRDLLEIRVGNVLTTYWMSRLLPTIGFKIVNKHMDLRK